MASSNNSESTEQQIQHLKLKRNILALKIKLAELAQQMASSNNNELTEHQIQLLELKRNRLVLEIKLAELALTEFEAETAQNHRILKMNTDGSVTNSAPMLFGSSGSPFSFTSAAPASSSQLQPVGSGDQMNMEDSMAEDQPVQASTPTIPAFGQIPISNPSSSEFMFSLAVPSAGNPFQFGGTQNQSTPQNSSPFQASGSLDFGGGGNSFSLGSGGKANPSHRRIVRVKHKTQRRHQPVQASTPTIPAFGQIPISNPSSSGFMFSSAVPSAGNPFQFGGTHNQSTAQSPSPFQASGSLDFRGRGSSFSSGSGGDDEANRRIVRVKHRKRRMLH